MSDGSGSWSTQQLTQLLVAVSSLRTEDDVLRQVAEQAAEALEAEVGAVATTTSVRTSVGFARGAQEERALLAATPDHPLEVPGAGPCAVLAVDVVERPGTRLVVARSTGPWTQDERGLLRAMARVLGLSLQSLGVMAELQERQALLERLSRIQRSISARKPLHEVLDSIVAGAAELLGEEIVALRLVDPADESTVVIASSIGIPLELVSESRRMPITSGIGGQAILEDRLVASSSYGTAGHHIQGFVSDGIAAALAAPVRQGGRAVGSLTIGTRRRDRVYSPSEQEALIAFAEHAGLALNDARTVDALHQAVDDATHQALHDSLTGLPNRALFLDRLGHTRRRRRAKPYAVLFIDVDDFKLVNDGLGHLVGDQLLAQVGERICRAVRTPDTVARLGGDEFAVILEDADLDAALVIAHRVLSTLGEAFRLPGGQCVHVGASVGLVSSDLAEGAAEELLRDADVAMYHAKSEGKGRVVVFERGMRLRLQARTALEHELRSGMERDELVVHYQPVVDLVARRVIGVEALVRWQHHRRGLVPPADFVPLAEETGLIVPMGAVTLHRACAATAGWDAAMRPLTLSVNVSPRQLSEPDLVDVVADALAASGLPPSRLVLEITESLLVQDLDACTARLDRLKALGVRLAVDDFGTGYSSLSYLSRLPVDTLKIDRSFVAGVTDGGPQGRLAGAIVALASSLSLTTVAEGVECPAQAEALMAMGATVVQGFAYAPPVPAELVPQTVAEVDRALAATRPPLRLLVPPARAAGGHSVRS